MDHNQPTSEKRYHRGILPKFSSVMQACSEAMPKSFSALLANLFTNIDKEFIALAEHAENDNQRNSYFEALHEIKLRKTEIEQSFYQNMLMGFEDFANGEISSSKQIKTAENKARLTLVEKEEYDKTLIINSVVNNACSNFLNRLFALNKRLAIVNGGTKLGEKNAALPTGPRHICNAFLAATEELEVDANRMIALTTLFEKSVMDEAGKIYDDFNTRLSRAGILPNLTDEDASIADSSLGQTQPSAGQASQPSHTALPQSQPNPPQSPPSQQPGSYAQTPQNLSPPQLAPGSFTGFTDQAIEQQLYTGITELLARRHTTPAQLNTQPGIAGGYSAPPQGNPSTLLNLMAELNAIQQHAVTTFPPSIATSYQPPITTIKAALDEQIAKLNEIVKKEHASSPEEDIIDLVGMLFEFILDDESMPDSVKALLSHLHTPYLKIALLDRKFFIRNHNPARKLLNAMSQAGSDCIPGDPNDVNVISKIQHIVNRVLNDFDENMELFSELLKEFSSFMENFNRRSLLMEKRAVAAAKGRDKLQSARRIVSRVIVDRSVQNKIPKLVENLLLGPWANFLVITILRHGESSAEWKSAVDVTDELIWSVQLKRTEIEREKLRNKLPKIVDSIRAGLELAGDMDFDVNSLMDQLVNYHKAALATKKPDAAPSLTELVDKPLPDVTQIDNVVGQPNNQDDGVLDRERQSRWQDVIPKEWQADIGNDLEEPAPEEEMMKFKKLVDKLKTVKLGSWFEFFDKTTEVTQHGKLAWINQSTSNYMFVNHGGRQIAVKSLYNLAKEIEEGDIKILPSDKTPFISKALNSIHKRLIKSA